MWYYNIRKRKETSQTRKDTEMKIYRVVTGTGTDFYGYSDCTEQARYFFNKSDAEALFAEGRRTHKVTRITTTFRDGSTSVSTMGAGFYESRLAKAAPYERVELVDEETNLYRFEEIEVE
jgi:hypothetical protein